MIARAGLVPFISKMSRRFGYEVDPYVLTAPFVVWSTVVFFVEFCRLLPLIIFYHMCECSTPHCTCEPYVAIQILYPLVIAAGIALCLFVIFRAKKIPDPYTGSLLYQYDDTA